VDCRPGTPPGGAGARQSSRNKPSSRCGAPDYWKPTPSPQTATGHNGSSTARGASGTYQVGARASHLGPHPAPFALEQAVQRFSRMGMWPRPRPGARNSARATTQRSPVGASSPRKSSTGWSCRVRARRSTTERGLRLAASRLKPARRASRSRFPAHRVGACHGARRRDHGPADPCGQPGQCGGHSTAVGRRRGVLRSMLPDQAPGGGTYGFSRPAGTGVCATDGGRTRPRAGQKGCRTVARSYSTRRAKKLSVAPGQPARPAAGSATCTAPFRPGCPGPYKAAGGVRGGGRRGALGCAAGRRRARPKVGTLTRP